MRMSRNGRSDCSIISSQTGIVEQFAAEELRKYVHRISGARLRVEKSARPKPQCVFLASGEAADEWCNRTPISRAKEDGFEIRTTGDRVFLLGQNARGLLYAVYAFLEDVLGVGFLAPGPENELIPSRTTVEIKPLLIREEPSLELRGYSASLPEEIDWMGKNRLNYILAPEEVSSGLIGEANKRGLLLYYAGHSFYRWLPPQQYWESHPEYYALIDGKRTCTYQQAEHLGHQQICVSNPDVIRIVSENLARFITEHPDYDFFTLWPNDADAWCGCENCRSLDAGERTSSEESNAGSYVYFANKVAETIARHHPKKKLNIIAYRSTMVPPARDISLHPSIVLEVAFWGRPCDQPAGVPITDAEIRRRMKRGEIEADDFEHWKRLYSLYPEILTRWGAIARNQILIYDYMMASQSTLNLPYPMFATIQADHKFYRTLGVHGCYMQAHKNNSTSYGLNYWMGAKAYWGGPQDIDQRLDEYCRKRYGNGWSQMKQYFLALESAFRSQVSGFSPFLVSRILSRDVVKKCEKHLRDASRKIRREPYRICFERTELHFHYSRQMRRLFDAARLTGAQIDNGEETVAFQSLMETYRIAVDLHALLRKLKGMDIISIPRLVKLSLLELEAKWFGDVPLSSLDAARKVREYLLPRLYEDHFNQPW